MDVKEQVLLALFFTTVLSSSRTIIHHFEQPYQGVLKQKNQQFNLGQQTDEPAIFKFQPIFEGNWIAEGSQKQFNEYENKKGWARCQFAHRTPDPSSTKMFLLEIVDGVFSGL